MKGFNNSIGRGLFMAGRKVQVALLTSLLLLLAGCIYADTPEWGTGAGQMKVTIDADANTASIQSEMGDGYNNDNVPLIECENSTIKVTGLIISSTVYSEHPMEDGINSAMGAGIIIHKMSYSEAENVEEGTAGRVSLKDWSNPVMPTEAVGSKLSENADDWAIIGIIPGSENIADGLNILEHWHEPVKLTGYLVDEGALNTGLDDNCKLDGQGHGMLVTNIETGQGELSLKGGSGEYKMGDTDIFGAWGFIFFFLIAGVGGGVGLFILSTMIVRQGAKSTAETLLGREGFAKAIQMKKDLKKSKKDGLESASDRAEKARKQSPPPKKEKKQEEVAIAGFNLDSVLSSSESDDSGPTQFGGASSVVVTEEAKEMSNTVTSQTPVSSPMPTTNVVSSTQPTSEPRGHFSASAPTRASQPTQASQPTETRRPVKKRKSVKRSAPQPEAEPAPQRESRSSPSVADDEEFSDFSF